MMAISTITAIFYLIAAVDSKMITCYFEYNHPPLSDIDPHLCTHFLLIGSCTLDTNCRVVLPKLKQIREITGLKRMNGALKVMITLTPNNICMSKLVTSANLTNALVNDVTQYLVKNSVDGFDIDWEFPSWGPDSQPTDKKGLANLVKEFRRAFDKEKPYLLLTAAVGAPFTIVKKSYDISSFNKYLDFVQIMHYDYHMYSTSQPFTAFNAPLFKKLIEIGILGKFNSDYSTRYWLDAGLFLNKTVFGIPTYGRGYTLLMSFLHYVYAPAIGNSKLGPSYGYQMVCNLTHSGDYKYEFDDEAKSPYVYGGEKQWLGFEDIKSIYYKAKYAADNNLAGIMVFDLGSDDYKGLCGKEKYPLIKSAKAAFVR